MGDDQPRLRVAVDHAREIIGDRRQPAATVDQHRHVSVGRELEDRREALVVQQKLLRAGVQLDALRAQVEAALRLADRVLGQVEANKGDQLPVRALGICQRPVVARAEARMPVGLVQAEHEAAGDPVLLHAADQVVVDADHAVDVGPEMRVRVEDVGALGKLTAELVVPLRHQLLGTLRRVVHGLSLCTAARPRPHSGGPPAPSDADAGPLARRRSVGSKVAGRANRPLTAG